MPFLDILLYLLLGAFGIVLWGICGLFVCAIFRNLKPMPKKPEFKSIPIYPPSGLSINQYRQKMGYDPYSDEEWPRTKANLESDHNLTMDQFMEKYGFKPAPKEAVPAPFDQDIDSTPPSPTLYDQEENPWNERNISAKGQNNV